MIRLIAVSFSLAIVVMAATAWWLLLAGSSAKKAEPSAQIDIAAWRALVDETGPEDWPTSLNVLELGRDVAPAFLAQAGRFGDEYVISYTSFQIAWADKSIVVGGAVDAATATAMTQTPDVAEFYPANYNILTDAMLAADQVLMTHEHIDHVMAIARHPDAGALAPRLMLNQPQIDALPKFADGPLHPALVSLTPRLTESVQQIAPGVVVARTPGHTPGSLVVFVRLQDGEEYLLIGDITWKFTGIDQLRTRPMVTQVVLFDPNEDRVHIKAQLRALHDLSTTEPDLVILPSHDRTHVQALVDRGALTDGFVQVREQITD
ncbi:MAG: hypothetical protein AAGJ51_05675 [Pseudomonadota bacterium]